MATLFVAQAQASLTITLTKYWLLIVGKRTKDNY